MMLNWFDARDAADVGTALADQFAPQSASAGTPGASAARAESTIALAELLRVADSEVRGLRLNIYKKAKFASSFKSRLIGNGVKPELADEVTQSLIAHLSRKKIADATPSQTLAAAPGEQRDSGNPDGLLARADECMAAGDFAQAATLYREFLGLGARRADVINNLGVALCRLGRYQEAEQRYREAIDIDPDFADALFNLAAVLQGNTREAEECLQRVLKVDPKYPGAHSRLGVLLSPAGRLREAESCFREALEIDPQDSDALLGLSQIARTEGRFEEAESLVKRVLQANPKSPSAWAALKSIHKMSSADDDWLRGAEQIAGSGISLREEAELRFAIGKYCDDVEDFDRAFHNYQRGNELLKSVGRRYDREAHSRFADDMIRGHTRESMAAVGTGGSASMKPIFVLGMPRSGTSLIEQIIASHPAAKGAGEPEFWLNAARKHHDELRRGILAEPLRQELAEEYLRDLERQYPDALRIVDKTLINSDYVGLLHSAFPRARMIRMRRDPIDTCLSCYFQHFSTAVTFTMDLSDLAAYYRVHQRLMEHWCSALPPGTILEVPYEELVADQEAWTRKILDFLGLEWDARCLSFYETERTVNTASAWQVRQKMYQKSVGRWRNYEKFIGPLKALRDPNPARDRA